MGQDLLNYQELIQEALRAVVRRALEITAAEGLPGSHHFYITFRTDTPGVELSGVLKDLYPEEMTIVLQYQFRELEVSQEAFSVTLTFSGVPQRITVPFTAMTSFNDPAVELGLRFAPPARESAEAPPSGGPEPNPVDGEVSSAEENSKVLSFEEFRKTR